MISKKFYFYLFVCSGVFLVALNFHSFVYLLSSSVAPGWDGSAHLAIGELYAKQIFPWTWGWIDNWYLGMPFPQFYPPAFYFLAALFSKIFFFLSYDLIFRIFVFLITFLVPGTVGWCALGLTKSKRAAGLTGLVTALLLSFQGQEGNYGVSITSTINTGLFSQTLGFLFFVIWLRYFLDDYKKLKNYLLSVIFLSLVFLSSVHLAFPAFIFFCVAAIVDQLFHLRKKQFKESLKNFIYGYLLRGILSFLIAAFWLIPVIIYYKYFLTEVLLVGGESFFYTFVTYAYIPFFLIAAVFISLVHRQKKIAALSITLLTLSICVFFFSPFVSIDLPFPFHFVRWIPPVIFLFPIVFSYLVVYIYENISKQREKEWFVICIGFFIFFASFAHVWIFQRTDGLYKPVVGDGYFELQDFFKDKKGSVALVGFTTKGGDQPLSFAIDAALGREGVRTLFSNIRESAMDGLYLTAVRNLLSDSPEAWGINSFLTFDDYFLNSSSYEKRIDMARWFGVRYIVIDHGSVYDKIKKSNQLTLVKQAGNFTVFEIKNYNQSAVEKLDRPPIAVFSEIGLKDRTGTDVTFSRFSEEWMNDFNPEIIYFRPNTNLIEENSALKNAGGLILASYNYQNLDKAEENVRNFAETRPVIIFNTSNPLVNRLAKDNLKNLYILNLPQDNMYERFRDLYPSIQTLMINNIPNTSTTATLIKESYFPAWDDKKGKSEIYMSSPGFILSFDSVSKNDLEFKMPLIVRWGYLISLLSLICLIGICFVVKIKRNKNTKNKHIL